MLKKFSVIDLFCGCGGLSLGLENAGWSVVVAMDNWDKAVKVYEKNFNHQVWSIDLNLATTPLKKLELEKIATPTLLVGGPPCQDFSSAGNRIEGSRADLTITFAQIAVNLKPQWIIMENVPQAAKAEAYIKALDMLKKAGYGLTVKVLDASLCGVPQKRKRLFCIAGLGVSDNFLLNNLKNKESKESMTVKDYMGDKLGLSYYYRHPRSYERRGVFSIDEPSPTIRGVNRPIPPGYKRHTADAAEPQGLRSLTTIERAQLQTFPEKFVWLGSKTETEQMIGNAVPPKLGQFVGEALLSYIKNN